MLLRYSKKYILQEKEAERDKLWERLMKNKLLILPSGDRSIRFRPHLNVKEEELDYAIDIIEKSFKIKIGPKELNYKNFSNLANLQKMIEKK